MRKLSIKFDKGKVDMSTIEEFEKDGSVNLTV